MSSGIDPASEERIEEMLEIERDLREQYDDAQIQKSDPAFEDDEPVDSRLNEYTGRVIDFERNEPRAGMTSKSLRLKILCHDGTKLSTPVPWPEDPTDETEELVRLCEYVDVPIDRVAELQGEYVPMESRHSLDIPPIPTRGNRLVYSVRRFLRRHSTLRSSLANGGRAIVTGAWVPALYYIYYAITTYPDTVPLSTFFVILFAVVVFVCSFVWFVMAGLPWLFKQKERFFPKAG